MANVSDQLSDEDLVIDTSNLSKSCSEWNSSVLSADLGSLDISGSFRALTNNGVGVSYIDSLQNALKKSEKLAINITNLISSSVADQETADSSGQKKSYSQSYSTYYGSGSSSSSSGGSYNNSVDTGSYESDNSGSDLTINTTTPPDEEQPNLEFTDDDKVKIVEEFQSIFDGELFDYLFDTNFASKIKEKMLSTPNLSDDLKMKISSMDQNEIQTYLKNIYVSGSTISDFSKIIVTIFDNDLKTNFKNATIYDSAESIRSVYSFLSKQSNYQDLISEIYFGTSHIEKVDESVIYFTRNFIDTLATASNDYYENVLNDSKYSKVLLEEIKDLSNTFAIIDGANRIDSKTASNLYSNIIIKEG